MYNDSFKERYNLAPIAISENNNGADTAAHIHAELELLYVTSGEWCVSVSDKSYTARVGDIIVVNPYEVHSVKRTSEMPATTLCICADPRLLADKSLAGELCSGDKAALGQVTADSEVAPILRDYFCRMYRAVEEKLPTLLLESSAYLSLILSALTLHGYVSSMHKKGRSESFFSKIQDYLSLHYSEAITSEDVARELFFTQSYFCRLFKRQFGTSFLDYLSLYRISKAKGLLENPEAKVSEVAAAVGFMDSAYFSRCFKRLVGISPSEYKKYQYSY